jgi:predicted transcriptional regulator
MKKHLIFLSIFILAAVAGYSQRGGGGSRAHQGQTGQRQGQQGSWGQQGQQQRGTRGNAGDSERQRARINSQQKKQLGECSNAADGVRKQAQKMSRTSGNQFNATESRQQFNQMQEQVRTMEQQHKRLMEGLDGAQQSGYQKQVKNMDRLHTQLNNQMQQMNSELAPANPDPLKVREQARLMERTMNELKQEYNTLSDQAD